MSIVGVLLATAVDIVVPIALIVWLSVGNARRRRSLRNEAVFWGVLVIYVGVMATCVVPALMDVPRFEGFSVIPAVLVSLPMSAIPAIVNSVTMGLLFSDREWSDFGYLVVMPMFLAGLIAWALLLPVAIRAVVGIERVNRRARIARSVEGSLDSPMERDV